MKFITGMIVGAAIVLISFITGVICGILFEENDQMEKKLKGSKS